MMPTLILTLRMDPDAQAFFERLRQLHFPPERNLIPAHLTLFHQLPQNDTVTATLAAVAEAQPRFPMQVVGLRSLGRGVAYDFSSSALLALHKTLSQAFAEDLIAQDKQRFKPHVVIQNKVTPAEAKQLLALQQGAAFPETVEAHGLDLWQYLEGPWKYVRTFAFPRLPRERVNPADQRGA